MKILSEKSFGVGLDLPWDQTFGFARGQKGEGPSAHLKRSLEVNQSQFDHFFFAFQPKNRSRLNIADYEEAYTELFSTIPSIKSRGFHQTVLNLGSLGRYDKRDIIEFTNVVCEKFDLRYVNEDLGIWSIHGKALPYPLPPILNSVGIEACVRNIKQYQDGLKVPLLVEFPGFTEACSFVLGDLHAYEFFSTVVERSDSLVTLDTGHMIGYQWFRGLRGQDLFSDLSLLPLRRVVEVHLAGSAIVGDQFRDVHHGILLDQQIELLERLIELCPNLQSIVYEDPKFTVSGHLLPLAQRNFSQLKKVVERWKT